jgi:hypothetical protein
MADFQVVTLERHGAKYWLRNNHYGNAAGEAVCPLVFPELPKAMVAMPIAFVADGDGFVPVAVQGLSAGKNLFVAPDGRWLTSYTPAAYRSYPFRIATIEDGGQVICIDESSDLISDTQGERFFNEDGTPSNEMNASVEFLNHIDASRSTTRQVCNVLKQHELIQPWPIKVQGEQGEQQIDGLFGIDEAALNSLSAEALFAIRNAGALTTAYCQLLSMQHLPSLGKLARAHADLERAQIIKAKNEEEHAAFLNDSGTFNFGD